MPKLLEALKNHDMWLYLAVQDVRLRYRRSVLGPFWITISMAIFSVSIGIVYSQLFDAKIEIYLPYLTVSIIIWTFFSSSINESTNLYLDNAVYIKDLNINVLCINLRALSRQLIILGHNMLVVLAVVVWFRLPISWSLILVVLGLMVMFVFLVFLTSALSLLGARYRDVSQLTINLTQVLFFLTPITWETSFLRAKDWIYLYNPIYHFINIIRAPFFEQDIKYSSWAICISLTMVSWLVHFILFKYKAGRVAFWV
jgi:ABC-type polysaccharide/polyol phosphate export permease